MKASNDMNIMDQWLISDETARISGLDLKPVPHPILMNAAKCIIKGQASVFFLRQFPRGNIWLLKKFAPSRRPSDDYLKAVTRYLPGGMEFFTCTQRRLLSRDHLDSRASCYKNSDLADWLEGTILMPKVPGTTWASIADDLRDGNLELSIIQRLEMGLNLVKCVSLLEAGQCSHRDFSSTNVFIDLYNTVYLIDWDCLYHPNLPFQTNTTLGTMGYIPRFMKATHGNHDAAVSWCENADRFALAILITEILLVSPATPAPREDGTLFSQSEIDAKVNSYINEQVECLKQSSKACAVLLEQALAASKFKVCPSPDDWAGALKYTLRKHENRDNFNHQNYIYAQRVRVCCDKCGTSFQISKNKYNNLNIRGKLSLCKNCFQIQRNKWSVEKTRRNMIFPQVCCEHCQEQFRMRREKLNMLRERARPILCTACLVKQLRRWQIEQGEYEKNYPQITCAECRKDFRLRKDKLNTLSSEGKAVLCRDCLEIKLKSNWRIRL